MPIHFRCGACGKLLGIATRKAGTDIACPHCATTITVPSLTGNEEPVDLSDIEDLLNEAALPQPVVAPAPPAAPAVPSRPSRPSNSPTSLPNVELVTLPSTPPRPQPLPEVPLAPAPRKEIPRVGDMTGHIVMSYTKVTVLVVAVAIMMFVSFVAGYRVASRS